MESDPTVKSSLQKKLVELKERHQLNLVSLNDLLENREEPETHDQNEATRPIRSQISNLVINAAVLSAIALKKSPIPGNFILLRCLLDTYEFNPIFHRCHEQRDEFCC